MEAFQRAGFKAIEEGKCPSSDLVVFLHSTNAQWSGWPKWKKRGTWIAFIGNEHYKHDKKDPRFDLYCSQYPQDVAETLYGNALSVPHALNPHRYFPTTPRANRKFDIGFIGNPYPNGGEREAIASAFRWTPRTEIVISKFEYKRLWREWPDRLNTYKATIGTEGVGGCLTSRHMEAIGTETLNIVYPGRYSDVMGEPFRFTLQRDHSNLQEALDAVHDDVIPKRAREYMLDCHTHDHRVKALLKWPGLMEAA